MFGLFGYPLLLAAVANAFHIEANVRGLSEIRVTNAYSVQQLYYLLECCWLRLGNMKMDITTGTYLNTLVSIVSLPLQLCWPRIYVSWTKPSSTSMFSTKLFSTKHSLDKILVRQNPDSTKDGFDKVHFQQSSFSTKTDLTKDGFDKVHFRQNPDLTKTDLTKTRFDKVHFRQNHIRKRSFMTKTMLLNNVTMN